MGPYSRSQQCRRQRSFKKTRTKSLRLARKSNQVRALLGRPAPPQRRSADKSRRAPYRACSTDSIPRAWTATRESLLRCRNGPCTESGEGGCPPIDVGNGVTTESAPNIWRWRTAVEDYVGIDVSLELSSICVVGEGRERAGSPCLFLQGTWLSSESDWV